MSSFVDMGSKPSQSFAEAKAYKSYYQYQTKMAELKHQMEEEAIGEAWEMTAGRSRSLYAKGGVEITSGSPLMTMKEGAEHAQLAKERSHWEYMQQAALNRWYSKMATKGAKMVAAVEGTKTGIILASMAVGGIAGAVGGAGAMGASASAGPGGAVLSGISTGYQFATSGGGYGGGNSFLTNVWKSINYGGSNLK